MSYAFSSGRPTHGSSPKSPHLIVKLVSPVAVRAGADSTAQRMRVLGIETSSISGSVALVEAGAIIAEGRHGRANAHGESIQPLIDAAMAEAGWSRSQLDRIAVGVGPGSFTGLRVGIALALGIGEGLQIPVVGVGSMAAMAAAAPSEVGLRCAVLDARREEVFAAAYAADGTERLQAVALPKAEAAHWLRTQLQREPTWIGAGCSLAGVPQHEWEHSDLPSARFTARLGARVEAHGSPQPLYVRNDVAVRPRLPPNPLSSAKS